MMMERTFRRGCGVSRTDVRGQLVLDESYLVAQLQLALFQALHLDDVLAGGRLQRLDGGIEVTVFLAQARELSQKLVSFFFGHVRRMSLAVRAPLHGRGGGL